MTMKRVWIAIIALLICPVQAVAQTGDEKWSGSQVETLLRWASQAPRDALPVPSTRALEQGRASGDTAAIDTAATDLAMRLSRAHLFGVASQGERAGWNITDTDHAIDLHMFLHNALAFDVLDTYFALLRPTHEEYAALKAAYATETDQSASKAIARSMERWRWMPRTLGDDYVLVNAARFEASLWRDGEKAGTWRVIVGKKSTPTPVFQATITGVILNPWWEIPASIVRESVGSLVRRNPSLARSRGYVWSDGRYRQKPGPNNALGQMKLVMPNRFSVYMHDTPNKALFEQEVRAYSHGCIRTGDAIGYAATLLQGVKTREEIDEIVASQVTTTVNLARPIPVYITYFTAFSDGEGGVTVAPDIYGRDRRLALAGDDAGCAA